MVGQYNRPGRATDYPISGSKVGTAGRQEVVHKVSDLPKGFRYQGFDWKIKDDENRLYGEKRYGTTDFQALVVSLTEAHAWPHVAVTMLHELMHVIDAGNDAESFTTEDFIGLFSRGLYAVLTDNPELRDFIWPEEDEAEA